jgi:hypothetical protein
MREWEERVRPIERVKEEKMKEGGCVVDGQANGYANGHATGQAQVNGHSNGSVHFYVHPTGLDHYSNLLSFLKSYVPGVSGSPSSFINSNTNTNTSRVASTALALATSAALGTDLYRRSPMSTLRRLALKTIPEDEEAPISPPQTSYPSRPFAAQPLSQSQSQPLPPRPTGNSSSARGQEVLALAFPSLITLVTAGALVMARCMDSATLPLRGGVEGCLISKITLIPMLSKLMKRSIDGQMVLHNFCGVGLVQ